MKTIDYITENKANMIRDMKELVNIPSVYNEGTICEGKPFGEDIAEALECFLDKAAAMGMQTKNYDGFVGEITLGKGDKIIGILGHVDVVSAGDGWNCEPFEMKDIDGKLFGRGTLDDKGPLVSCLYAMKYLMEEKMIPEGIAVRMIVGADEEENWGCIEHYRTTAERLPDYSIVPDGSFPIINCEKGLLDVDFSYDLQKNPDAAVKVENIYGGTARNSVPGNAYCTLECNSKNMANKIAAEFSSVNNVTAEIKGTKIELAVRGKSTHAMSPEKGINAISSLMSLLEETGKRFDIEPVYDLYSRYVGMTYNGEKFGCSFEDEDSGKLTFNVGTIEFKDGKVTFGVSVRYPVTVKREQVIDAIKGTCEQSGIRMSIKSELPALYVDKNSTFIDVLMNAYRNISGDIKSEPISIGGATYARTIPNAVAFGPVFPYEEELAHEANEFIDIESLKKMTLIYIEALKGLTKMVSAEVYYEK